MWVTLFFLTAPSLDVGDLVLLEEVAHPLRQLFRDRPAALLSRREVDVRLGKRDPVRPCRLEFHHEGGAGQKRLGGNAPYVETNTPEFVSLDTRDVQP